MRSMRLAFCNHIRFDIAALGVCDKVVLMLGWKINQFLFGIAGWWEHTDVQVCARYRARVG